MKNIYFYIYPEKKFAPEYVLMSEAQIENSLNYWDIKDILLVTNFPHEYKGVKSIVVGDELNAKVQSHGTSLSNKPLVIKYLIEHGLVDELNWFHDWDMWQLAPLNLSTITKDIAIADYSYKPRIHFGSVFFKPLAWDIAEVINNVTEKKQVNEEEAFNILARDNINNINDRFEKLDVSYNVGMMNLRTSIQRAQKPLKIAHFPPHKEKYLRKATGILPPSLNKIIREKFTSLH